MKYTDAPICVVDDDVSVREAVSGLIRCAGLSAKTYTSAKEFLASPRIETSCLVLDIEMPGLSGIELQEELAKADFQVPIIFLTGRADIPMTVRALKAGAIDFLTKPVNDEALLAAIRKAVESFRAAREKGPKSSQTGGAGLQDRVLPVLAHELLQPVNAILLCLEEASMECDEEPADRRACDLAKRQARQMARIIHNLMDVCRDSRGKLHLDIQRVDVAEIFEDAITSARPSMAPHGHQLVVTIPPEPVFLNADAARLKQVLTNLLTNAAKFTDPGGTIRLTAEASSDAVVIRIRDNGRGISPDLLPVIFNPFQQGNDPAARGCGLGLGLSLVKSLVELHGGTITAHSEGAGKGAEFTMRLPVEARRIQAAQDSPGETDPSGHRPTRAGEG